LQETVIIRPSRLEIEAEIEDRLAQYARLAEHQRDEQAHEAASVVKERMDDFKLHVGEAGSHQGRQLICVS
jgi:hypothetical protein